MFKKLLILAFIALPMCVMAQTAKFGTVNSQAIFELMPERSQAETKLQAVSKNYEDEFKKLQDEFQKKYQEFQQMGDTVPDAIKQRRMQELQDSQGKIENFQKMAQQDLQRQQEQLLAPISQKLQEAIKSVGAEGAYTFIFDLAVPAVVYSGLTAVDVTPMVKTKLGLKK